MDRTHFIKDNIKGKVLDIGCSDGQLHRQIFNNSVYGLDIKVSKDTKNFVKGDAQAMPFKDNSFDTLIAGELIEHLYGPEKFLRECKRLLKKEGILIITTPNKNSWVNKLFKSSFHHAHVSFFDKNSFQQLVSKYFKVKHFFCLPYDEISSWGSKHKEFFWFRKLIHNFLPEALQEEMIIKGINS